MTDAKKDAPNKDDTLDNLDDDWAAAMSEQQAGTPANQAQGLSAQDPSSPASGTDAQDNASAGTDDWAAALAEQTAAQTVTDKPIAADPKTNVAAPSAAPNLFQPLTQDAVDGQSDIDMIMDIPVQMSVELGRTRLTIKNILQLGQGSVVELDGLAGEPMDIYVNGYLIAQGEVVVVDDKYGIRVTDIITPSDRINRLNNRR